MAAQPGIFALGTVEHCYLEFDLVDGAGFADLAATLAATASSEGGLVGVNAVVGVRPELWRELAPEHCPPGARSFEPVVGPEVTFPASQHDGFAWLAGGNHDAVFDAACELVARLSRTATVASELWGWVFHHHRDLTGFIDGTENPSVAEAPEVAAVASGPGAGASVLLFQRWAHLPTFAALGVDEQERVIGRTKPDSVELDDAVKPADSHVARTVIEEEGRELEIYRRNTSYGGVTDHGTVFVGFAAEQRILELMLASMAGLRDGVRDALTRFTVAESGAYYVIPSLDALSSLLPDEE